MKLVIESKKEVTDLDGVPVRMWEGTTGNGTRCIVFVHRIAVDQSQGPERIRAFEAELKEMAVPGAFRPRPIEEVLRGRHV